MSFKNNQDSSGANDVYVTAGKELKIEAINNGQVSFESGIKGDTGGYDIAISGDTSGEVDFSAAVENVNKVSLANAQLKLANEAFLNNASIDITLGTLNIANNSISSMNIANLTSNNGYVHLDVDPLTNTADVLMIDGDIVGDVGLILNVLSIDKSTADILFADAQNDNPSTSGGFSVFRVLGSP